ncbi:chaperone modulator CbpM [Pedobacter suwonensis]|uniref:chaperone modulator CbpM n=1 Tax=Pedobacter suwonensis TaxID=332999 RepID=UPI00261473F1|nr:chaperone modulator CbpM [uncultured Pedobacter sp.]
MKSLEMIPADEFCLHHNIEISFIYSLRDSGLIEVVFTEERLFVPMDQLAHLEKLVRLHYNLDINLEGLETINHLLGQIDEMQQRIIQLSNRLGRYEDAF